jgi:glucokinase
MEVVLGIDIGGTNTKFGLVNIHGEIVEKGSVKTANYQSANELALDLYHKVLAPRNTSLHNIKIKGIGIGAPNGNFYTGNIEHAPNLQWKGIVPLKGIFEKCFGFPTTVSNDANAAALGEMQFGKARGMKDFLVVTLGTGLGSGFVVNGQIVYGHDGFAGELGHTICDYQGRLCGCGRRGCLETYVSAGGIVKTYFEQVQLLHIPHPQQIQEPVNAFKISQAALNGDIAALKAFDFTAEILGKKLADAVAFSSPEAIILFGGLARSGDLLMKPLTRYFESHLLNIYKGKIKILLSALNESDAAILGAASLVWFRNDI